MSRRGIIMINRLWYMRYSVGTMVPESLCKAVIMHAPETERLTESGKRANQ